MSVFKECLSCNLMITDKVLSTWECPNCGSHQLYTDWDEWKQNDDNETNDEVHDDNDDN